MAALLLSGLAKQLLASARSGEGTSTALGGYDRDRTAALMRDAFGAPQELPPGVPMVRHTFVIGGGKGCRQKFDKDLPKNITAALREIGFAEDKSADTSASSAGTFKRQHDTGANLIYCHVYPNVAHRGGGGGGGGGGVGEEEEEKGVGGGGGGGGGVMGLGDLMSRPMNLCVHAEMGTFRQMVAIEVTSWCQKKNLLTELADLTAQHAAITQKMIDREELSASEERLFELDVEGLGEKITWLKKIMKQQVTKQALTANDVARLVAQVDEKLADAATGDKAKEKLAARREMLSGIAAQADNFKGRAELLRLYVKLYDIQKAAGNAATVKQLTAIKGVEDMIGPLEQGARGWFEEDTLVQQRLAKLRKLAKSMKPKPAKKSGGGGSSGNRGRARRVNANNGGWSTVAKKGGNRFSAFD